MVKETSTTTLTDSKGPKRNVKHAKDSDTSSNSHSNENSPVRSDPTIVCVFEGLQLPYDDSNFNVSNYSKNADEWIIKMITNNVSGTKVVSTVKKNLAKIVKVLNKDSRFSQKRVHFNKELFSSVAQKLRNPQWYLNIFLYVCILSRVGYFNHDSEDGIFSITKIEPANESANVNDHEFLVGDRLVFKNDQLPFNLP